MEVGNGPLNCLKHECDLTLIQNKVTYSLAYVHGALN